MLNVGRLDKRITFMMQAEGDGEYGQTTQEWKPWKSVWATVRPVRASERYNVQKIAPEEEYRIVCRYGFIGDHVNSDMKISCKIRGKDRLLDIIGDPIDRDGDGEMIEFSAKEYRETNEDDLIEEEDYED